MKKYVFDRNDFDWSEDFYNLLKNKLNLPERFGGNADALWDMLTRFVETPCEVIFKNFDRKENEYDERNINLILACFKDFEKNPTKIKIKFE